MAVPGEKATVHIVFYKTYMPPTYLLAHNASLLGHTAASDPRVVVYDARAPDDVFRALGLVSEGDGVHDPASVLLIRPLSVVTPLLQPTPDAGVGGGKGAAPERWTAERVATLRGHVSFDVGPDWTDAMRRCSQHSHQREAASRDLRVLAAISRRMRDVKCALHDVIWNQLAVAVERVTAVPRSQARRAEAPPGSCARRAKNARGVCGA